MIYDEISSNKRNSIILISVFLVIIIALGYVIGAYFGSLTLGPIIAVLFSLIFV